MSSRRPGSRSSRGRDTEQFLLAAKRSEIVTLQNLADSCRLVTAVSALIHQLQRERGISNIFLASGGTRFADLRREQVLSTETGEDALRRHLQNRYLDTDPAPGDMRLFNSIAFVLQGLDDLPELRRRVETRRTDAPGATRALSRVIAGLLSVVFEAADSAGDPAITRALVAVFNFMQGKEYAGQERAWAAIGFAAGAFDEPLRDRLSHLQEAQQRSFATFLEFAPPALQERWSKLEAGKDVRDLGRLRTMIEGLGRKDSLSPEISEVWYDLATRRIDAMKGMEDRLAADLLALGERQVARAQQDLQAHHQHLAALAAAAAPVSSPPNFLLDTDVGSGAEKIGTEPGLTPDLTRSVYDLVRGQAEHLRRMSEELNEARRALRERKQIERAKGLLMQNLHLTEEQAYRRMQRRAMELNTRLAEVADTLIDAATKGRASAAPSRAEGAAGES